MTGPSLTLHQESVYKSIYKLPDTELPPLAIVTGPNGSGKSHLLEAIQWGNVSVNVTKDFKKEIQLHSWSTLVPNDVGMTNIGQVHANRDWFIEQARNRKAQARPNLANTLRNLGLIDRYSADPWLATEATIEDLLRFGLPLEDAEKSIRTFEAFERDLRNNVVSDFGNDEFKAAIYSDLIASGTKLSALRPSDFDLRPFTYYGASIFQQSFGMMFYSYFDKLRANRNRRMDVAEGRTPSINPLSEDEFVGRHGAPPWDFVNDMMARAKLDFRIDHPVDYESTQYLPQLTKISTGTPIDFSSLSSGEKVLMSFAFCLYYSADPRQNVRRPKLLLFDEIDAPLHPSMSRVLVEIVHDVLVRQEGIPVIFVTHSPSTVAVAPEESIYILRPGTNQLERETKRRAVSTLTVDIPTLSIDFSGRRQVLVESDFDADRYARLYQLIAPSLESERSLIFIGVGRAAEAATGAAPVYSTVGRLSEGGNISIFGLVDWDTHNKGTDRVVVLAEGTSYAIENVLLNPLLVAAVLLSEDPAAASDLGLEARVTFVGFAGLPPDQLQLAVNNVQQRLLNRLGIQAGATASMDTIGGHSYFVDAGYLVVNGHELEEAILQEFAKLRRLAGTGRLMQHMIDTVLRNHPSFVPASIVKAMRDLCDLEV